VTSRCVVDTTFTPVPAVAPKTTRVTCLKPVPVTETRVPPSDAPFFGLTLVTTGMAARSVCLPPPSPAPPLTTATARTPPGAAPAATDATTLGHPFTNGIAPTWHLHGVVRCRGAAPERCCLMPPLRAQRLAHLLGRLRVRAHRSP